MARSCAGCRLGRWFRTVIRAASFKKIPGLVRAALLNTTAGTPIEICLQDAARLGQQGTLADVGRLTLPPYSPELNPMENVRDDLRQNKLGTFLWNSDDESLKATKSAWTWLIADPDRIRPIGARAWALC